MSAERSYGTGLSVAKMVYVQNLQKKKGSRILVFTYGGNDHAAKVFDIQGCSNG